MHLLVTRPAEDGEATAGLLREMGHEAIVEPLLKIEYLDCPAVSAEGVQALVATSANGIRAFTAKGIPDGFQSVPITVIGEASSQAADDAGFTNITVGGGTLPAMARDIIARFNSDNGKILYLTGRARSGDLAGILEQEKFSTLTLTLYEAVRATSFTAETLRLLQQGEIDGVLLFSARTAAIFADLLSQSGQAGSTKPIAAYCFSQQVADRLGAKLGKSATISVAREPTLNSILDCVGSSVTKNFF